MEAFLSCSQFCIQSSPGAWLIVSTQYKATHSLSVKDKEEESKRILALWRMAGSKYRAEKVEEVPLSSCCA